MRKLLLPEVPVSLQVCCPKLVYNLDGTEDHNHLEVPDGSVEDTILHNQQIIDSFRRTLDETSVVSGPTLRPVLEREISKRKSRVDSLRKSVLTRSKSVIVSPSASTPEPSHLSRPRPSSFFGSANNLDLSSRSPSPEPTKFPAFEIYQDPVIEQVPKIRIVETPASVSVGKENYFQFETPSRRVADSVSKMPDVADTAAQEEQLKKLLARLKTFLSIYDPEKHTAEVLKFNQKEWVKRIEDTLLELMELFHSVDDDLTQETKAEFEKSCQNLNNTVATFLLNFNTKVLSINDVPQVQRHEVANEATVARATVSVDVDVERIQDDIKGLSSQIRRVDDWTAADNVEIEMAMKKLDSWRKNLKEIKVSLFNVKKIVKSNNLDEASLNTVTAAVNNLEAEMEIAIDNIEYEDQTRCLFSLSKAKPSEVKYPTFGGGIEEDYNKWEREIKVALKSNCVRRDDQVSKVREHLKNHPKSLVPENLDNVDAAFSTLRSLYGDPSRMMKHKKDKLMALGQYPKPGSKAQSHIKMQLDWLMQLELLLKDVFELAKLSEDSYCEFFSPSLLKSIKAFFPYTMCEELSKTLSGSTKDKMEQLYDYIVAKRSTVQDMFQDSDVAVATDFRPKFNNNKSQSSQYTRFKSATRNEKCRICKQLESVGDTDGLYEDHFTNTPYGCPRFAAMSITERRNIVWKCRICRFCLDPDYIQKKKFDRHQNCPGFNHKGPGPNPLNCSQCKTHFLLCDYHSAQNKEKFDTCLKFWSGKGKPFSCSAVTMSVSRPVSAPSSQCPVPSSVTPAPVIAHSQHNINEITEKLKRLAKGSKVFCIN